MAYNNSFDLNKYETVKSRKVRLRQDHPNAHILPLTMSDLNYAGNYILTGALIWKDKKSFSELSPEVLARIAELPSSATPQNAGIILTSLAILSQADGAGYSLSMAGGKGADRNAWVENAEESAIGRALDNMGYQSGSASQEEMKKVQHMQDVQQQRVQFENQINALYGELMQQGHNPQYLSQVIQQTVKPFNQLSELSVDELEKLLGAMQSLGGQSAYQQQKQQQHNGPQAVPMGAPAPRR